MSTAILHQGLGETIPSHLVHLVDIDGFDVPVGSKNLVPFDPWDDPALDAWRWELGPDELWWHAHHHNPPVGPREPAEALDDFPDAPDDDRRPRPALDLFADDTGPLELPEPTSRTIEEWTAILPVSGGSPESEPFEPSAEDWADYRRHFDQVDALLEINEWEGRTEPELLWGYE